MKISTWFIFILPLICSPIHTECNRVRQISIQTTWHRLRCASYSIYRQGKNKKCTPKNLCCMSFVVRSPMFFFFTSHKHQSPFPNVYCLYSLLLMLQSNFYLHRLFRLVLTQPICLRAQRVLLAQCSWLVWFHCVNWISSTRDSNKSGVMVFVSRKCSFDVLFQRCRVVDNDLSLKLAHEKPAL